MRWFTSVSQCFSIFCSLNLTWLQHLDVQWYSSETWGYFESILVRAKFPMKRAVSKSWATCRSRPALCVHPSDKYRTPSLKIRGHNRKSNVSQPRKHQLSSPPGGTSCWPVPSNEPSSALCKYTKQLIETASSSSRLEVLISGHYPCILPEDDLTEEAADHSSKSTCLWSTTNRPLLLLSIDLTWAPLMSRWPSTFKLPRFEQSIETCSTYHIHLAARSLRNWAQMVLCS